MRKKILPMIIIPVAAAVALTGTGLGIWVFNNNSGYTAKTSGGISLTPVILTGYSDLKVSDVPNVTDETIVLNQLVSECDFVHTIVFQLRIDTVKETNGKGSLITFSFDVTVDDPVLPSVTLADKTTWGFDDYIEMAEVKASSGSELDDNAKDKEGQQIDNTKTVLTRNSKSTSVLFTTIQYDTTKDFDKNEGNTDLQIRFRMDFIYKYKDSKVTNGVSNISFEEYKNLLKIDGVDKIIYKCNLSNLRISSSIPKS